MLSFEGHNRAREVPKTADMAFTMSTACPLEPSYPARLRQLPRVPHRLWFRGRLPAPGERGVAIVGSRAASSAGCRRTQEAAASLVRADFFVISGGALGIDAAAHQGALDAGGTTFAVLGCGVDVVYPDRHGPLFERIAIAGGLISEYPPGAPPHPGCFPVRNQIVAGLAEAVVVVEARPRSGALITARLARQQGQILMAVPGTAGTDQLIASGQATPVESGQDVVRRLAGEIPARALAPARLAPLLAAIAGRADSAAGIARRMEASLPAVLGLLAEAELGGWVRRLAGGRYEVSRAD
jgi:DNA processing protein